MWVYKGFSARGGPHAWSGHQRRRKNQPRCTYAQLHNAPLGWLCGAAPVLEAPPMVAMAAHVLAMRIPLFAVQLVKDVAALGDRAHVMLKVPRRRHAKRAAQRVWGPA